MPKKFRLCRASAGESLHAPTPFSELEIANETAACASRVLAWLRLSRGEFSWEEAGVAFVLLRPQTQRLKGIGQTGLFLCQRRYAPSKAAISQVDDSNLSFEAGGMHEATPRGKGAAIDFTVKPRRRAWDRLKAQAPVRAVNSARQEATRVRMRRCLDE